MKKFVLLLVCATLLFSAFTLLNDKSAAIVKQEQGLYIFIMSRPAGSYETLGIEKITVSLSGTRASDMLKGMIKKVKKDYPNANGILFTTENMDNAEAILLKDSN